MKSATIPLVLQQAVLPQSITTMVGNSDFIHLFLWSKWTQDLLVEDFHPARRLSYEMESIEGTDTACSNGLFLVFWFFLSF